MPQGNEFTRAEVDSIYTHQNERFVVSLIVGYGSPADGVDSPELAAAAALALTRDEGMDGTVWFVHDRQTGQTLQFEQSEFEEVPVL